MARNNRLNSQGIPRINNMPEVSGLNVAQAQPLDRRTHVHQLDRAQESLRVSQRQNVEIQRELREAVEQLEAMSRKLNIDPKQAKKDKNAVTEVSKHIDSLTVTPEEKSLAIEERSSALAKREAELRQAEQRLESEQKALETATQDLEDIRSSVQHNAFEQDAQKREAHIIDPSVDAANFPVLCASEFEQHHMPISPEAMASFDIELLRRHDYYKGFLDCARATRLASALQSGSIAESDLTHLDLYEHPQNLYSAGRNTGTLFEWAALCDEDMPEWDMRLDGRVICDESLMIPSGAEDEAFWKGVQDGKLFALVMFHEKVRDLAKVYSTMMNSLVN